VQAWDVAAGLLVVAEAGGVSSGLEGQPFELSRPQIVAAASELLQRELLHLFGQIVNSDDSCG
jgi:fructose-1,6-bisphosphatase/inositol monophosphatase family enzyme